MDAIPYCLFLALLLLLGWRGCLLYLNTSSTYEVQSLFLLHRATLRRLSSLLLSLFALRAVRASVAQWQPALGVWFGALDVVLGQTDLSASLARLVISPGGCCSLQSRGSDFAGRS